MTLRGEDKRPARSSESARHTGRVLAVLGLLLLLAALLAYWGSWRPGRGAGLERLLPPHTRLAVWVDLQALPGKDPLQTLGQSPLWRDVVGTALQQMGGSMKVLAELPSWAGDRAVVALVQPPGSPSPWEWLFPSAPRRRLEACRENLKRMAAGIEIWFVSHGNTYPPSLEALYPPGSSEEPRCPAGGHYRYQRGSDGRSYRVFCEGSAHVEAGVGRDFPAFSSTVGMEGESSESSGGPGTIHLLAVVEVRRGRVLQALLDSLGRDPQQPDPSLHLARLGSVLVLGTYLQDVQEVVDRQVRGGPSLAGALQRDHPWALPLASSVLAAYLDLEASTESSLLAGAALSLKVREESPAGGEEFVLEARLAPHGGRAVPAASRASTGRLDPVLALFPTSRVVLALDTREAGLASSLLYRWLVESRPDTRSALASLNSFLNVDVVQDLFPRLSGVMVLGIHLVSLPTPGVPQKGFPFPITAALGIQDEKYVGYYFRKLVVAFRPRAYKGITLYTSPDRSVEAASIPGYLLFSTGSRPRALEEMLAAARSGMDPATAGRLRRLKALLPGPWVLVIRLRVGDLLSLVQGRFQEMPGPLQPLVGALKRCQDVWVGIAQEKDWVRIVTLGSVAPPPTPIGTPPPGPGPEPR